ncbi:GntR family transcriptional regulator [Paracoccus sp. MBLB3053]|uniref:GntR family transcriptional regulator n=1 Tax=Paracoccus aurantius TaxID=3073814 RepID=A0ABU2HWL9_9RHOB|nr:GntR family transcriptional regulator [Paracoccus sp. MBLB3053]MDS9469437.1 GntR family transcriptional regulator [Paracoccus sp. MBLB3053]
MAQPARQNSAEAIAASLAHAIHEHRLTPGSKLSEDEVGEVFGVSRTVVRAALQRLGHSRLVEIRRNHGAFVAQPSIREAQEVFEARLLLEPRTSRAAASRISPSQIEHLRQHIRQEHEALEAGRSGQALHLSGQFHVEIARIADQDTITEFISQLVARSSLVIALYWQRRAALCESHAHAALIDALATGNEDKADELMKEHLISLMTSLDLRNRDSAPASLREALRS